MTTAFIVRPFGVKEGIDFDRVEKELIRPALAAAGIEGGTTGEILRAGNIRHDMFQLLLTADVVIADVSIHNANVFYELGVRHALRAKHTVLIRCSGDSVPFDIKTDRYFSYPKERPEESIDILTTALTATTRSKNNDSPVYQLIPNLEEQDAHRFLVVPNKFAESVERAQEEQRAGDLELLAAEASTFSWAIPALRLIGRAQFRLRANEAARSTWERVLAEHHENDPEANELLGTIYQRLEDLTASDQAIDRFLKTRGRTPREHAEAWSLKGRNDKTRWLAVWENMGSRVDRRASALSSPFLSRALDNYQRGFLEDGNHYYSGINALFLATVLCELGESDGSMTDEWLALHPSTDKAEQALEDLKKSRRRLVSALSLSIEGAALREAENPSTYLWREVTEADYQLLTSDSPAWVQNCYRRALAGASPFDVDSVRRQLLMLDKLGVREDIVAAVLDEIGAEQIAEEALTHVVLFVGHMIDRPDRLEPRFPASMVGRAREAIEEAMAETHSRVGDVPLLGIGGGACGGDIIFHEVCRDAGVLSHLYLALPRQEFIAASVQRAGPEWVDRFNLLYERAVGSKNLFALGSSHELPSWLQGKPDYSLWVRNNLWILFNALSLSGRGTNLSVIALWDGKPGDGPGGTEHMVRLARERGARVSILDTRVLFET